MDPILGLLALAHAMKIDFGVAEKLGWTPYNFEDSVVYYLMALEDIVCSATKYPAVPVRY